MADMKYRRLEVSESGQEIDDSRYGIRIVSPLSGGFPFVKGALHINDDQRRG
jgi:hypothetical protein